ncbi:MAG TPA: NUDIX hydrolase [Pseudonocardiaceae bacterium]|nr:NUDIX hydrolase [Pseudonocardiaceae bacterium]
MSFPDVRAAGTVLWRQAESGEPEIAVVHRPRYDDWSLPKGKVHRGETLPACAVRETAEETGFRAVLDRPLIQVRYAVPEGEKAVDYFAARVVGPAMSVDDDGDTEGGEVDELRWLSAAAAGRLLDYDWDREVLAAFAALPAETATVLLVRHAKAGHRSTWDGDDDLRPLSPAGQEQAAALRMMLPLFQPDRVHTAPLVRCEQTVAGVAADMGVSPVREPALAEAAFARKPAASLRRLDELIRAGGRPVISSQGGAIPGLIRMLAQRSGRAQRSGLALDQVPCKKGSVWVLSLEPAWPHRLLAADYLPTALPAPAPQPS